MNKKFAFCGSKFIKELEKEINKLVKLEGGNAYVLTNYKWITVGYNYQYGTTAAQLYIEFNMCYVNNNIHFHKPYLITLLNCLESNYL
ncbi:MAG: hypothetical protein LBR28_03545 [Bacteroidales bacterium]|jgi:hypothetical protein|nr:hypothetical protein [Bacteroidales bacterium]